MRPCRARHALTLLLLLPLISACDSEPETGDESAAPIRQGVSQSAAPAPADRASADKQDNAGTSDEPVTGEPIPPARPADSGESDRKAQNDSSTADLKNSPASAVSRSGQSAAKQTGTGRVDIPDVDIPFTRFKLDNGLTVIVHEDRKAPLVAVNMWYHVGSKDEGPDQTGFAHLFEHLMFQGSENWQGEYFEPFERAGATEMNGTTSTDRTNYFANVPTPALDMALWMESDRMGNFLGAIDQARLDEQRNVVLNEKRQRNNQPYGKIWELLPPNTYPGDHPYSWSTIGSEQDLNAASVDDVKDWFKRYYGPSNAVLVLAGDISAETAREKVTHYFGNIPAGPPLEQQAKWIAPMSGEHRMTVRDRVPQARVYKVWNIPPDGADETVQLEIIADLLAGSKNSRLYKRLVYEDQIATDVTATVWGKEIGSQFMVWATARPGVELADVERVLNEEMARFLKEGPDKNALERSRTSIAAGFLRGSEKIGGFGGKSDILARGQVFQNDPAAYKSQLAVLRSVDSQGLRATARQWLDDGVLTVEVQPFGEHSVSGEAVDRGKLPDLGEPPSLDLPTMQRATLDNGLEVLLAQRDNTPITQFRLIFDAGYAADPQDAPGTASLAMSMLDEGTEKRSALDISAAFDRLGATFSAGSSLDVSTVSMSALSTALDPSLDIFADVVRNPAFPEKELLRLKKQKLAAIRQEKSSPTSMALRALPPLLYGDEHAYGIPFTGSGTEASITAMTADDMAAFHQRWLRPDNAQLLIVGDLDMEQARSLARQHFGGWQATGSMQTDKRLPEVKRPDAPRVFLVDRPGTTQATIIAGNVAPPKSNDLDIPMSTVNAVLGGTFNSRLNLNLREDKHWSYGARTSLINARAQQPFIAFASVQIDKTAESMREIRKELKGIRGDKPVTPEELSAAQANLTRSLPGDNETTSDVAGSLSNLLIFDLDDDYYDQYTQMVQALNPTQVMGAARVMVDPEQLTWVVVGDLEQIEDPVRALKFGEVTVLDDDAG
ncbi:MAG: peptidase M16 [Salinisphaeraceae bacterium]|nr:peptidase M16 [Salinisphaeraceae bacterium]